MILKPVSYFLHKSTTYEPFTTRVDFHMLTKPIQPSNRIMKWHVVRPSVNIWLSTGVTTCRINFNFTDIMHLVHPIHDTGNGSCSSLNMHMLTQLLIFAFWSFLGPFFKLELQIWYSRGTRETNQHKSLVFR